MARLKQAGPPDHLLRPNVPAGGRAIPPTAESQVIRPMISEAMDAETAGAEGIPGNPGTAPGSNRSIPEPQRSLIVPPDGWHIP